MGGLTFNTIDASGAAAVEQIVRGKAPVDAWPEGTRLLYKREQSRRIIEEGRFLLILGMLVCLSTLAIDAVVMPQYLAIGAQLRILVVAPITLIGLYAVKRRSARTAAFAIGGSLIAFAMAMLFLTSLHATEIASRAVIGLAMLPGIALLILPLPPRGLRQFSMAYAASFLLVMGLFSPGRIFGNLDVLAVLATGLIGTYQIALRHEALRQRSFLLDLKGRLTTEELFEANRKLRDLSERDPLTGLNNRRHFERVFEERFAETPEGQEGQIAVMMIDLDHFKRFNDRHGHQAGDHCLKLVGNAIDRVIRKHEATFARYGGEEFILAMRESNPGDAKQLASRICEAIAGLPGRVGDEPLITTSVGVATAPPNFALSLDEMIEMADAALYAAKHAGRDRYELVEAGDADERLCA